MADDDFCVVCAEPLEWVAYGNCGHRDACSKCVSRLRFVMKDTRCLICQQQDSPVVVTRSLGAFTPIIPPQDFDKLQERAKAGELYHLASVNAYFDDLQHYQFIKSLCSYTHPALALEGSDASATALPRFPNLKELRRHLSERLHLHFCPVCLEGRKVFISEQVLYTDKELKQHGRAGDVTGALAESGFSGHPSCRFCRRQFYGDTELFVHMHQTHEQCFLCRRARPDKYVYYRNYAELEGHFGKEHFPCDHPECLESKFVVFATEQELRKHRMERHRGDMVEGLSRSERRAALTIPINVNYRRGGVDDDPGTDGVDIRGPGRPGITIGGADGVSSRFRASNRAAASDQSQLSAAMQASLRVSQPSPAGERGDANADAPQQQQAQNSNAGFRPDDFPAAGASGAGAGAAMPPRWAAAAGGGRGDLGLAEFPELPGATKSAKRRAAKQRTLAEQLAAAGAGVRVINRGVSPGDLPPAARPTGPVERFPSLPHSASEPSLRPTTPDPPRRHPARGSGSDTEAAAPSSQEVSAPRPDSFPALQASQAAGAGVPKPRVPPPAASPAVYSSATASGARRPSGPASTPVAAAPSAEAFPSLGGGQSARPRQSGTVPAAYAARSNAVAGSHSAQARGAQVPTAHFPTLGGANSAASAPANRQMADPSAGGATPSTVSEALKAANKELVDKARRLLSDADFAAFRQASGDFMAGRVDAAELHRRTEALGAATLVPDVAALCPDPDKRRELLAAYREAAQDGTRSKAQQRNWVPPEAVAAAADAAEQHGSWTCSVCTLMNAPQANACEACGSSRQQPAANSKAADQESADLAGRGAEAKSKPKKVSKFERTRGLSLNSGDPDATRRWLQSNGAAPELTAARGSSGGPREPGQPRGMWARQGQLAQQMRVVQDAYGNV